MYEGPLKEAIHKLKYRNNRAVANTLADLTVAHAEHSLFKADLVTGVPLHPHKENSRGYNQAYLLCQAIARLTDLSFRRTLAMTRKTLDQSRLTVAERRKNVKGAFVAPQPALLQGKAVLLVDDVYTTGSTSNECARVLLQGGAKTVMVWTIARSILC